ncbi:MULTISPECIES: hypothetical protein [Streptomyces]|uniref:Uncharacterized protein n=2 Tax=Streptomyces TaxID=1883 RepID=A0ABV9IL18_9ACTN
MSYFDGAAATGPALTLTWWAALGLGAVLLGAQLKERTQADTGQAAGKRQPALVG